MSIKGNFSVSILDFSKIDDVNEIIIKHANITMKSSSFWFFDKQPVNLTEAPYDVILFKIECEDENELNKKINVLIENLNQLNVDYALRNQETGEMLVFVEFVGALHIKFDKLKIIKEGTYKKIDELKLLKTDYGICMGYKPNFRPMESQSIEDKDVEPESIYFYCHSQEDLMKLKEFLIGKIMEIEPDFEIEFQQYTEKDLY